MPDMKLRRPYGPASVDDLIVREHYRDPDDVALERAIGLSMSDNADDMRAALVIGRRVLADVGALYGTRPVPGGWGGSLTDDPAVHEYIARLMSGLVE